MNGNHRGAWLTHFPETWPFAWIAHEHRSPVRSLRVMIVPQSLRDSGHFLRDSCLTESPRCRLAELRTIYIMLRNGIAQFVGSWVSGSGYRLGIKKVRNDQASVDFLDPHGAPVERTYMGRAPSIRMIAHYDDYYENFEVDLWEQGKGFTLHLAHEYDYVLDPERREALVPAISRNERDHFLDSFYSLFGPLDHFVRRQVRNKNL